VLDVLYDVQAHRHIEFVRLWTGCSGVLLDGRGVSFVQPGPLPDGRVRVHAGHPLRVGLQPVGEVVPRPPSADIEDAPRRSRLVEDPAEQLLELVGVRIEA
jgi:hypothetical protein